MGRPTAAVMALHMMREISSPGVALAGQQKKVDAGDDSRAAGGLRGPSDAAMMEARVSAGFKKGNRSGASGSFVLFEKCFTTQDCMPGLFTEAGFRTQCKKTPFSGGDAVCCKPFGTPCDSNEACCTGNCNTEYTRCGEVRDEHAVHDADRYQDDQHDANQMDGTLRDEDPYGGHQRTDEQRNGVFHGARGGHAGVHVGPVPPATPRTTDAPAPHVGVGMIPSNDASLPAEDGLAEPASDRGSSVITSHISEPTTESSVNTDPDKPPEHERSYSGLNDGQFHDYGEQQSTNTLITNGTEPNLSSSSQQLKASGNEEGMTMPPAQIPLSDADWVDPSASAPSSLNKEDTVVICEPDYSSGMIDTIMSGQSRLEAVTVDSQGNVFYTLSAGDGKGDAIWRASSFASGRKTDSGEASGNLHFEGDSLIYSGNGVILAMTVDADDNLVFTMEDASTTSGGVYLLRMETGGTALPPEQPETTASVGNDGHVDADKEGDSKTESDDELDGRSPSAGDHIAPAVVLAASLGPFLPGIAVCPITQDVYVTRGHMGIVRLVRGAAGDFSTKVEWGTEDIQFEDGGHKRGPLMVWDIAVNSIGIVYFSTYTQGVVLKAILPRNGGTAHVRLEAGTWDSGVTASSGDGGPATSAMMAYPKGIAIDGQDAVYIAEFQGQKIRRVSTTGIMSTIAGTGRSVYEGDGGPALGAGLDMPNSLAFIPGTTGGKMAIADFGHSAIRVITPEILCPYD